MPGKSKFRAYRASEPRTSVRADSQIPYDRARSRTASEPRHSCLARFLRAKRRGIEHGDVIQNDKRGESRSQAPIFTHNLSPTCPVGTFESSPAFQRWVPREMHAESPVGMADCFVQSSLRDSRLRMVPRPALKRWAIFEACLPHAIKTRTASALHNSSAKNGSLIRAELRTANTDSTALQSNRGMSPSPR